MCPTEFTFLLKASRQAKNNIMGRRDHCDKTAATDDCWYYRA